MNRAVEHKLSRWASTEPHEHELSHGAWTKARSTNRAMEHQPSRTLHNTHRATSRQLATNQLVTCSSLIVSPPLPMIIPALLPGIIISNVTCPSVCRSGKSWPLLMIRPINSFALLHTITTVFLSLSFSFGVAHAPFACQCWGLPHRLAPCATQGKGLV